jgi:hypothetical protein
MPTLQMEAPERQPDPEPPRRRWTRAECAMLESCGVLDQERLELIEGELISRMGKKRPHANASRSIFIWLQEIFGVRFVLEEEPVDVATSDIRSTNPFPISSFSIANSPSLFPPIPARTICPWSWKLRTPA